MPRGACAFTRGRSGPLGQFGYGLPRAVRHTAVDIDLRHIKTSLTLGLST